MLSRPESALAAAARSGDVDAVASLLKAGPRLEPVRRHRMGATTKLGGIKKHASSSCDDDGAVAEDAAVALAVATINGHAGVVRLLLANHADPHVQHGEERWTVYHLACFHDRADALDAVVRAGCDARLLDAQGRTGCDLAEARCNDAVLARLRGPLARLREDRLRAKRDRRKLERRKRVLLGHALLQCSSSGLFLEFGVASGASVNFIAERVAPKVVHGFDSFQGLPERWRGDYNEGLFDRDGELPTVAPNVHLHVGWFKDTLPAFIAEEAAETAPAALQVAFLHIDCDLYSSSRTVLTELAPLICAGTVIVFDEYCGYDGWEQHEARAWAEFCEEHDVEFEWLPSTSPNSAKKEPPAALPPPPHGPPGGGPSQATSRALVVRSISIRRVNKPGSDL